MPYNGRVTFILRLTRDEAGRLNGVIERVRSGEKSRFYGVEEIGPLIVQMAAEDMREDNP